MDLVKIGFIVTANGLKEANAEVDKLLNRVDKIGSSSKKNASEFENSQKKIKKTTEDSTKANDAKTKAVERTTKALERQRLVGEYLGKGLDKTTASAIANFKQLGGTTQQINTLMTSLADNQGLVQAQKDSAKLARDQVKAADYLEKNREKRMSSVQKEHQQQMELLAKETTAKKAAVQKSIDEAEKARQKKFTAVQKEHQQNMEFLEKERNKVKQANAEREKAVLIEQNKRKYVDQGYGKGDAKKLATLETSGVSPEYLDRYKKSLATTTTALGAFGIASKKASNSHSGLMSQIKGIAFYAVLSAAIYKTITALTDLAVSIVDTADEMTNLTQRLSIYLPANIEVNQVLERMGEIAKENRVTLADTGKLFTQLLPPIQRIKGGVAETTAIVDAFGKAMLVGGANTMEAASATIQFGQAMASGKLAGDEFRSLAEASPRLLQAIADGAGIAAEKLKEMSAAGKLTSGLVSAALLDQFIQLEYEATKMGQTVSGAFNEGMVAYQLFVHTFNEQTGFTTSVVESIRSVVKSLEGFGKGFLASLKDGDSTLNSFLGLLKTVWDLVVAVVGGFTDVVGWLLKAGEKTGLWKAIFDSTKLAIITVADTLAKIPFVIVNIGTRLAEHVLKPFEKFIALAQKGLDLAGFDSAAARLGQGLSDYRGFMGDIKGVTGEVVTSFNLFGLGVKETADKTGNIKDILDKLKQQNKDLVIQETEKKAMTDSQYISEYAKLLLQKEGVDVNAENLNLVKKEIEERFKITQEQAKQLKIAGEAQAKKDEAEAKAKKAAEEAKNSAEQEQKRLQGIRASYDDQIAAVVRLNNFKAEGMSYDVAKIAAEKDYYEAYTNVEKAFELAEARKTSARIDAKGALENETLLLTKIHLLQEKSVGYELARTLAQAAFSDDQEGMLAAAQSMHNEIVAQQYSLADQVKQQTLLNHYLDKGLSIEEATVKASFKRLEIIQKEAGMKGLSDQQKKLKEEILENQKQLKIKRTEAQVSQSLTNAEKQRVAYVNAQAGGYANLIHNMAIANKMASDPTLSPSQAEKLVEAEELTNYEKELAELKRQTYIATFNESEAVKDIISNYATWDSVQVGVYDRQQKLLGIAKELSDEAEKQHKNPIGDFSSVDFNVFGDFGNPFESALAGLNEFVAKSTESRNILASIEKDIVAAKEQGLSVDDLELERNIVLANQEKDRKKSIDKGITTSLALTKSLFKEESKGYKIVSGMEKAYQAGKIAFQMWKNREKIKETALELWGYAKSAASYVATTATKVAAEGGLNIVKGIGAILSGAQQAGPLAFVGFAAMAALVAGLGVSIAGGGLGSSSSGSVTPANDGTGTVFGDSTAQSESIKNSIELLSENSDLMLPLTSAMLRSLRNIESSLGGVANLIIRGDVGNIASGLEFDAKFTGTLGKFDKLVNGVESFVDKISIGKFLGFNIREVVSGLGSTILGGLFGKTSASVTGSGLFGGRQSLGNVMDGGFNLSQYADVTTTKKSWFSKKTSYSTQYQAASKELSDQFGLIFTNVYDSILSASSVLGRDENGVIQKLRDSIINIGKIDTKGKTGKEIQEALESVIGQQSDLIAKGAVGGLEDFQKVGEGYFETLMRVATGIETADYFTDRLNVTTIKYNDIINKQGDVAAEMVRQSVLLVEGNKNINGGFYDLVNTFDGTAEEITDFVFTLRDLQDQLFMTGKNADYLTSSMILGAGGLDKLSGGFDAYFEMLSPAEQAAELTRRLTNEFAIFGKELPSDVKAFRNLVSSIDITTGAGQKLYGQILALAPEFNDLQDALESTNSEVNALVQSLRDLAEQARAARGETEQPRNLAYTRSQFEQASVLAMQGDIASAEKLLTLGKDLMGLSKTYSVTGSEYARDLALIQRAATVSADMQEQGLGTSISTTLTPSSSSTTTPTVNTTNSTMTTELQGMREELNAGLFAIAKFVQNVDSRTERWDDGSRMLVGVQPENGDIPVPVTVVP